MSLRAIVGRFGSSDNSSVSTSTGEIATPLNLIARNGELDHGMGRALSDLVGLGVYPTEIGIDLLILASHVHAADTRISRGTESQDSWTREIRLIVPVSNTQIWTNACVTLERMLNFLTGDRWKIDFRQRPGQYSRLAPRIPTRRPQSRFDALALFSGGLDSLISAIDILEGQSTPLLVSHAGDPATSHSQQECVDLLKQHYQGNHFERLRVWLNVPSDLVRGVSVENTTRARSFLFISLGILAGTGFESRPTLNVPENGFIALNVPLDQLRLGSFSTRTTHPFYLARWRELLGVLGIAADIVNPYAFKTKGEMISVCLNSELLSQILPSSLSCSSPSKGRWQGRGIEHCGHCLPCLVRRAAVRKAFGRRVDPTRYTLANLSAHTLDSTHAEGAHARSIQYACERIRANPALTKLFIHKPGSLSDVNSTDLESLAQVYQRGLEEVGSLLANVRTTPQ